MRDTVSVPVISIVSKGGIRTAHLVKERLENNDPVIILAKSGGVASIIFRAVNHMIMVRNLLNYLILINILNCLLIYLNSSVVISTLD